MATEPVSLVEARDHLKLDLTGGVHPEDLLIQNYITAARQHVENLTGRTLVSATQTDYFDCWQDEFVLTRAPVTAVSSVKYVAEDGTLTTLATSVYRVDIASLLARVTLEYEQEWPAAREVTNAIQIAYTTGSGAVTGALKQAVLLLAAHWFESRVPVGPGSLDEMPHMVTALVGPYRVLAV
jgi:uncharacterized phiE125 gp8 family phage protein